MEEEEAPQEEAAQEEAPQEEAPQEEAPQEEAQAPEEAAAEEATEPVGDEEAGNIDEDDYPDIWGEGSSFEDVEDESEDDFNECMAKKELEDKWNLLSDEDKKFYSKTYIEIIMDIGTQNRILNHVKKRLCYLTENNPCPTKCEEREIRGLKCCLKREIERQQCYMRKAGKFLASAPCGPWDNIPIATTDPDNCLPTELCCTITEAICKSSLEAEKKKRPSRKNC